MADVALRGYRVELLVMVDENELQRYCDEAHTGLPRDPLEWQAHDFLRACAFSLVRKSQSRLLQIEKVQGT